ncbi:hypothetical protein QT711_00115 [Sporosarcina saromensis]|uniref:Lipoprotein n=1 Tax=Sporosarcina saromensis TaxID=359365 RepID=A0ABU4G3R9_9BACL|nr:DUF6612 family protein [Sporosarcina saromensis]MDW0111566.1 hypothetical protein [Sporosarcina saromensis]
MKKILSAFVVSSLVLLVTACNNAEEPQKKLTAGDLLDKSEQAMNSSLTSVSAHVVYDEYNGTVFDGDPEKTEKSGVNFDMNMDAFLDPMKVHRQVTVQPRGGEVWNMDIYDVGEQTVVADSREQGLRESETDPLKEAFGTLVSTTNPLVDLAKFKTFNDDFKLEEIGYDYVLKLSLDRDEFPRFKEIFPEVGPSEEGFLLIDRMEITIKINKKTSYVTGFNMYADMKIYSKGNSFKTRQKLNATYSYFNDIEDFTVPKEVTELVSR